MRWFAASIGALAVLVLTFPVLAAGSSDGPGECRSLAGLRTLGSSESCDTWGVLVSVPFALVVFVAVAWALRRSRRRGRHQERSAGTRAGRGSTTYR